MASFFQSLAFFCLSFLHLHLIHKALSLEPVDPTQGFLSLPLNHSYYHIQKPYDVPEDQRYSFINGVHKCWVYSTDKPHTPTSQTKPRTEIAIQGYNYSLGVWQFQGYGYVPDGTSGVCIMQVFGASHPRATTLMLRVYNGSLMYYRGPVLVPHIYNRWFRLNVIHDVDATKVKVYKITLMGISNWRHQVVRAHLTPSNVASMPKMMTPIAWSLVGKTSKFQEKVLDFVCKIVAE